MKIGVKLFPGSIVALLLGVFLAAPLLYTNIVMAPAAAGPQPLLGVEVTYAYIEQIDGAAVPDSHNANETIKPGSPIVNYLIGFNFTRLSKEADPCDAKFEVYLIKFYSDKGFIGNLGRYEGIIYNRDLVGDPLRFDLEGFFGGHRPSGGGSAYTKWDVGESMMSYSGGGGTIWGSTFGEPESIFVRVSLLGWIAMKGNSTDTVILGEPKVVAEAQLEKFGDGFLYNTIIPEDELSQIDPLNPTGKLFELKGDLN
ncbi:MAG: hypothetical protein JSW14_05810 [Candidatus Bathyarchaeum sp.]|nr:MAG: hypothetical protein JSW14_05810 [Candidatus Bathyarchaeum sp.]